MGLPASNPSDFSAHVNQRLPPCFSQTVSKAPATVAVFSQSVTLHRRGIRLSDSPVPSLRDRDGYALEEVLEAVESVLPAIEVVGCRFEGGYDGLGALSLVADATAHTAFVSGKPSSEWSSMDLNSHRGNDVPERREDFRRHRGQRPRRPTLRSALDRQPPIAARRHHRGGRGSHHRDLHRHNACKPRRYRNCRLRQPGEG